MMEISEEEYLDLKNSIVMLKGYIIRIRAYELISSYDEGCLSGSKCSLHCEKDYERCPDIEHFKKLAREELEKEGGDLSMEFSSEEINAMWDKAVEEALVIWRDRASGLINNSFCPFCEIDDLLNKYDDCNSCILGNCYSSPYGMWQYYEVNEPEYKKSAGDMVKMLEAYRDGNMEEFNRYLNYWDDDEGFCTFEEAST